MPAMQSSFDPTLRDRVHDATAIEDIINADLTAAGHAPLNGNGQALQGWHHTHDSKSGTSLKVNPATQLYHCFNCGEGGSVFDWLMHNHAMTFPEALHALAQRAGIPLPGMDDAQRMQWQQTQQERHALEELYRAAALFYRNQLSDTHRAFALAQWGLSADTLERYGVGFAPTRPTKRTWEESGDGDVDPLMRILRQEGFADALIQQSGLVVYGGNRWHDFFQGRLIFPYWRDLPDDHHPGTPLYFMGRHLEGITPERPWEEGKKYKKQLVQSPKHPYVSAAVTNTYFYGEHVLRGVQGNPLLVTEGAADCLAALQAGLPCISPATVHFPKESYPRLLQLAKKASQVIIANDADEAGIKGAMATAVALEKAGIDVRLVIFPRADDGVKIDLAEYLKRNKVADFQQLCAQAPSYLEMQLQGYAVSDDTYTNCQTARNFVTDVLASMTDTHKVMTFLRYKVKDYFHLTGDAVEDLVRHVKEAGKAPRPQEEAQQPPNPLLRKLKLTKSGRPHAILANVMAVLVEDPRWHGVLGYNELTDEVTLVQRPPYLEGAEPWTPRAVYDADDAEAANWLQGHYEIFAATSTVSEGLDTVAHRASYHPIRDYLHGLVWDRTPRLDTWLTTYCHAEENEYTCAVGSKTLIGAIARIEQSGCKMDTATILEGEQGIKKSWVWSTLASDAWFSDTLPDLHDKDALQALRGKWIIELGELAQFQRSEIEVIKRFLSAKHDHYRASYGRRATTYLRQNIFVGSTNKEEFFKDETGNRRFWPVAVHGECDIAALERDRDQLWAEALVRYRQDEPWHLSPDLEVQAAEEQAARVEHDAWEDDILTFLDDPMKVGASPVTTHQILKDCLHIENRAHWTQAYTKRIGAILRRHGWKKRTTRERGRAPFAAYHRAPPSSVTSNTPANTTTNHTNKSPENNDVTCVSGVSGCYTYRETEK